MKIVYLVIGLLLGGTAGFFLSKNFKQKDSTTSPTVQISGDSLQTRTKWDWSDSLDAEKAAPASHNIVYEDSSVRILQVILEANKTEPIHTHKWKSVMWFTEAAPMTYYKYALVNNVYKLTDTFPIPQMPPEMMNRGEAVDPELPHAIKNTGSKKGIAYRVEFKKDFVR